MNKPFYLNFKFITIKIAIWIYFWLWLLEGALRKWVLPGFATPLLVVRDPVAIFILYMAFKQQLSFINVYIKIAWFSTLMCLSLALLIGHQNIFVAVYGARIMLLHFPLIFIMGMVFTKSDVEKLGRIMLMLAPLMTMLIALQFNSPQSAWVNHGIGGDVDGAGFSGAMGYLRPPGTFSFISGVQMFYPLLAVYIFYFWLSKSKCNHFILVVATGSLLFALPITISRTAVFWVLLIALGAFIGVFIQGKTKVLWRFIVVVVGVFLLILVAQNNAFFQLSSEVFLTRVDQANQGGGLQESMGLRMLEALIGPLGNLQSYPLIDGRLGMGTNAGASLLGKTGFLISEEELGRLFGERGIILGLVIYLVRAILTISLVFAAVRSLRRQELLPWLFLTLVFFSLYQGQWAQPTSLGFAVLVTGAMMASLKDNSQK
jgi:hypothetical protein